MRRQTTNLSLQPGSTRTYTRLVAVCSTRREDELRSKTSQTRTSLANSQKIHLHSTIPDQASFCNEPARNSFSNEDPANLLICVQYADIWFEISSPSIRFGASTCSPLVTWHRHWKGAKYEFAGEVTSLDEN